MSTGQPTEIGSVEKPTRGAAPRDEENNEAATTIATKTRRLSSEEAALPASRKAEEPLEYRTADRLRDESQAIAKRARDSFRDACEEKDLDAAEANLAVTKRCLDELWKYAPQRDIPFRDLLGMLTASLKYAELDGFTATQKDVIRSAFSDLPRWVLEYDTVMEHIGRFAEHNVDITGPIRHSSAKRFRITIEEEIDNEADGDLS